MKDLFELIGAIMLIGAAGVACILLCTLPAAFLGWIVATIVGLFTPVSVTYFQCFAIGFGTTLAVGLIKVIYKGN